MGFVQHFWLDRIEEPRAKNFKAPRRRVVRNLCGDLGMNFLPEMPYTSNDFDSTCDCPLLSLLFILMEPISRVDSQGSAMIRRDVHVRVVCQETQIESHAG